MVLENNGIKKNFAAITVDEVKPSQYKAEIDQAQVRQVVTTTYPSKRAGNSLSDSLFSTEDFDFADGKTYQSTRITWIDVPKGTTKEKVADLLAQKPAATIQRVISNNVLDVLTDEQKSAIQRGIRTVAEYKESLLVKDGNGDLLKNADGSLQAPQYRQHFFKAVATEDIDLRVAAPVAVKANEEADMLKN
jgi:hypothetical protein